MYLIKRKKELNPTVMLMDIQAPEVAAKARAGQFIILRVDDEGERIPLTIADYDAKAGTVTIIFQIVGGTTMKLATLKQGDCISDFVGAGQGDGNRGHKEGCGNRRRRGLCHCISGGQGAA